MRRFMIFGLMSSGALLALLTSPGCNGGSGGGGGNTPPAARTWGVMAYVIGRNETSQGAITALNQLQGTNAAANVIVEAGFSQVDVQNPPFTTTREVTVTAGAGTTRTDRGNIAMTDANEAARYFTDAIQFTNAQRHLLVVHGHHGGPSFGVGADTIATVSSLDLAGLDSALTTARQAATLARFDIIVLDMPESATFEAVAICAKHATFLVAVEAGVPSPGFSETVVATQLANNPNIDAQSLANAIAQSMTTGAAGTNEAPDVAAVCVNLGNATSLLGALNTFASSLLADVTSAAAIANTGAIAAIGSARRDSVEMDIAFKTNVVDVASFVLELATVTSSGVTGGIANTTIANGNALTAAIQASYSTPASIGSNVRGAGGLAIYFPPCASKLVSSYAATSAALTSAAPAWLQFLNAYTAKLAIASQPPIVTQVNVSPVLQHDALFTVSATMTPVNTIQDVTLVVTINLNGADTVLYRVPLGPPDVNGNVSYTGNLSFVSVNGGVAGLNTNSIFVPLTREVRGSRSVFAFEADMKYVAGTASTAFRDGFVKVESVAGVPSGGLAAYAWTPIATPQNNVARNDLCNGTGATFTLFPRVFTISAQGIQTSATQLSPMGAYQLTANGISSIGINAVTSTGGLLGPAKVWIIAEGFNGEIFANPVSVTIQ